MGSWDDSGGSTQESSTWLTPPWPPTCTLQLSFWKADTLMVTKVSTEDGFERGPAEPLFVFPGRGTYFDVSPDGQTFLIAARNPDARTFEIHVVRNWFEMLKEAGGGH